MPEQASTETESVLVVRRAMLLAVLAPVLSRDSSCLDGFHRISAPRLLGAVQGSGFFVPRREAEEDPSLKQIIPYGLVTSRSLVFLLRRTSGGGEARLHEKVSLGVGGHINPIDAANGIGGAIEAAFLRELGEELEIDSGFTSSIVGLVNDDSTPVGRVHLGIVYRVEVDVPKVRVREEHCLEGGFIPTRELASHQGRMETWSRLLQEEFWPGEAAPGSTAG